LSGTGGRLFWSFAIFREAEIRLLPRFGGGREGEIEEYRIALKNPSLTLPRNGEGILTLPRNGEGISATPLLYWSRK